MKIWSSWKSESYSSTKQSKHTIISKWTILQSNRPQLNSYSVFEHYFLEDDTPKLFQETSVSPNISVRSWNYILMQLVYANDLYYLWKFVYFDDFLNIHCMWTLFPGGSYSKEFSGYANKSNHILDVLPTYADAFNVRHWSVYFMKFC